MLIEFSLRPLLEVHPWGTPGDLRLHWFGLTDGQYVINAGHNALFQYSQNARSLGLPPRCDYQVARLHEDLLDLLPYALEPVPASLIPYISGDIADQWQEHYESWCDQHEGCTDDDQYWEVIDATKTWRSNRLLDSLYLSPPANISIWSDTQSVYIEWDNRDRLIGGYPAWEAIQGRHKIDRPLFIREVESFHSRLMREMNDRIEQVSSGILRPDVQIDMLGLKHDHQQRCEWFGSALSIKPNTDWSRVERALKEVSNAVS